MANLTTWRNLKVRKTASLRSPLHLAQKPRPDKHTRYIRLTSSDIWMSSQLRTHMWIYNKRIYSVSYMCIRCSARPACSTLPVNKEVEALWPRACGSRAVTAVSVSNVALEFKTLHQTHGREKPPNACPGMFDSFSWFLLRRHHGICDPGRQTRSWSQVSTTC